MSSQSSAERTGIHEEEAEDELCVKPPFYTDFHWTQAGLFAVGPLRITDAEFSAMIFISGVSGTD